MHRLRSPCDRNVKSLTHIGFDTAQHLQRLTCLLLLDDTGLFAGGNGATSYTPESYNRNIRNNRNKRNVGDLPMADNRPRCASTPVHRARVPHQPDPHNNFLSAPAFTHRLCFYAFPSLMAPACTGDDLASRRSPHSFNASYAVPVHVSDNRPTPRPRERHPKMVEPVCRHLRFAQNGSQRTHGRTPGALQ